MNDIREFESKLKGNWKKFDSFSWYRQFELNDPDNWTVYYTHNRDSDILTLANRFAIEQEFKEFFENESDNIMEEDHNHWAVGWVKGYAIRVKDNEDNFTPEFVTLCDILTRLDDYPVLDEDKYSELEYESLIWNLEDSLRMSGVEYSEDQLQAYIQYCIDVYDYDSDFYPDDEQVKLACEELGIALD